MSDNNKRKLLPVKSDIVFRIFFADERDPELLITFLKSALRLPDEEYEIEIADPHLLPEYIDDKTSVIDVKLYTKTRKVIHIEIQLKVTKSFKKRIMYYGSKLITEQLGTAVHYDKINQVISIVITDENFIENSNPYKHRFIMYDPDNKVEFTDLLEFHTLELSKLPKNSDGTQLYDWASFIAADTEEELDMLAQRNPVLNRAVLKLKKLSADEETRDKYERREKALKDLADFQNDSIEKGIEIGAIQIALRLLKRGRPIEEIIEDSGLSYEKVIELKTELEKSN